jgi:hypothetical protein
MACPLLISTVSPNFNRSGGASWLGVSVMCAWCDAWSREFVCMMQEDGRRTLTTVDRRPRIGHRQAGAWRRQRRSSDTEGWGGHSRGGVVASVELLRVASVELLCVVADGGGAGALELIAGERMASWSWAGSTFLFINDGEKVDTVVSGSDVCYE